MDVKKRDLYPKVYKAEFRYYPDLPQLWFPETVVFTGRQRTESEGHPFSRIGKTGEDIGGNFKSERWFAPKPAGYFLLGEAQNFQLEGPLWPRMPQQMFFNETPTEAQWQVSSRSAPDDLMDQRGTHAIASTTPTNPTFSAAAAIGELREGLPTLPGKSALKSGFHPTGIADDFLNYQFGIKPLISDGRKLLEAHRNVDKTLKQLYRDSGRLVRRKYSFPPEVTTETSKVTNTYPYSPAGVKAYNAGEGTLTVQTKSERKFWFSGGYTYFFPKQEGWHRKIAELEKTYGIIPDINDVYQLTPWSWAVDWVSTTGDLVSNIHAFSNDNLVLRYGYVMCQTTQTVTETWKGPLNYRGVWKDTELTTQWRYVSKQRRRATPYGFGLDVGQFSDTQKAIIAALGISRFGKK